jgi:hypothetical protein
VIQPCLEYSEIVAINQSVLREAVLSKIEGLASPHPPFCSIILVLDSPNQEIVPSSPH